MRTINKIILSSLLATTLTQANEITIDSIGINLGISNIEVEKIGTIPLTSTQVY